MKKSEFNNKLKLARKLHNRVPAGWYDQSIKSNLFQRFWHKQRFSQLISLAKNCEGNALDIGCSDGTFTSIIINNSSIKNITGIDCLTSSVKYAKDKYANDKRLVFRVGEAHNLPFKNSYFDNVFCLETLEHLENPKEAINEIRRVLKKQGIAFILIPNENWLFSFIWFFWLKFRGKIWANTHIQHYSNQQLISLMGNGRFEIIENKYFLFNMLQVIKLQKI